LIDIVIHVVRSSVEHDTAKRHLDEWLKDLPGLIATARGLPPGVASRGLRWESAVIVELAARLARRLRRGDPLATRVALAKSDFAAAFLAGILAPPKAQPPAHRQQ
jgi:hypothetical protein